MFELVDDPEELVPIAIFFVVEVVVIDFYNLM